MATLRLKNDNIIKLQNDVHSHKDLRKLELLDSKIVKIKIRPHTKITFVTNNEDMEYVNSSDSKITKFVNIKLDRNSKIIVTEDCQNVDVFLPQKISKVRNCDKCFNLQSSFVARNIGG